MSTNIATLATTNLPDKRNRSCQGMVDEFLILALLTVQDADVDRRW